MDGGGTSSDICIQDAPPLSTWGSQYLCQRVEMFYSDSDGNIRIGSTVAAFLSLLLSCFLGTVGKQAGCNTREVSYYVVLVHFLFHSSSWHRIKDCDFLGLAFSNTLGTNSCSPNLELLCHIPWTCHVLDSSIFWETIWYVSSMCFFLHCDICSVCDATLLVNSFSVSLFGSSLSTDNTNWCQITNKIATVQS